MSLNPLGVLKESQIEGGTTKYSFSRGIVTYPTIGDPVILPSQAQLQAIVESGENRRVKIGLNPLAGNAEVSIDPDRLFGRHLAILGNTGSGKSCSVAGVIRWSIEAAKREKGDCSETNARFIILDPNGEYSKAFSDMNTVNLFGVEANKDNGIKQLQVPLWFWNSAEWCAFTQASAKAQRPTLIQALRTVRDEQFSASKITPSHDMRRYLRTLISILRIEYQTGNPWNTSYPKKKGFYDGLLMWQKGITENSSFTESEKSALDNFKQKLDEMVALHTKSERNQYPTYLFDKPTIESFLALATIAHSVFGGSDQDILPIDADIPRPFTGEEFLRSIEANAELMNTTEYVETMLMRIRTILSDTRMKTITNNDSELTLEAWLNDYICMSDSPKGYITVIDLSLVPAEVVHIITAVIARVTLEALQRYRHLHDGVTLPTTLVMEEAHTFIKKYSDNSDESTASSMCTRVFEKIAREGRKFGLGLVLSSQRPSELSPTVLSQCNTFLLHRISNDRDQELVHKLVPDNLRGLLRELPSLPSRRAILLGWASELPVMVEMNYLQKEHRPQSNDPDYWETWTTKGDKERIANWKEIADNWQQINIAQTEPFTEDPPQ
jgi:hypothetical protein